jgi:hypothetical protein
MLEAEVAERASLEEVFESAWCVHGPTRALTPGPGPNLNLSPDPNPNSKPSTNPNPDPNPKS